MNDNKRKLLGFRTKPHEKNLIQKFAEKSGYKSMSEFLRNTVMERVREKPDFSFKGQLDSELDRLEKLAQKQARKEILGSDFVGPDRYEERIEKEKSKLKGLQDQLLTAEQNTTRAIRAAVSGDDDLDSVDDSLPELKAKIHKYKHTVAKLIELKTEAENMESKVEEKAEELFGELLKRELLAPLCEEAEQVMSRLIDDLNLLDSLIQKSGGMYRRRSIGWRIQARLEKAVPGLFDYSFTMHPKKLDASIPEIFGLD